MQSEVEKMIHTETLTYDEVSLGRAPGLVMVLNTPKGPYV